MLVPGIASSEVARPDPAGRTEMGAPVAGGTVYFRVILMRRYRREYVGAVIYHRAAVRAVWRCGGELTCPARVTGQ